MRWRVRPGISRRQPSGAPYKRLYSDRVRDASPNRLLSDIVALVRFALDPETRMLEPFSASVEQRFNLWLGREKNAGRDYAGSN